MIPVGLLSLARNYKIKYSALLEFGQGPSGSMEAKSSKEMDLPGSWVIFIHHIIKAADKVNYKL